MSSSLKIFAVLAILFSAILEIGNVEAAEINFQELKRRVAMPVLPEKIRYRHSRRGPTKIIVIPKEIPKFRREVKDNNRPVYVQRQPKRPPPVYVPRKPVAYPGQRGSMPPKNFGPPRARYRR